MDNLFSPVQLKDIDLEGVNISELEKFLQPGGIENFSSLFPEPPGPTREKIIAKIFFYILSFIFAFFGNLLIIILILMTKGLRTVFNIYIVNLAVADTMVACVCMWIHLATDLSTEYPFGKIICRVGSFLQVLSVTVSVLSLTTVVLNRFLSSVARRSQCLTQTHYKLTLFLIWLIGVILSLPWLLYTKLVDFEWAGGHERYCTDIFPSKSSRTVYVTFFTCCVYAAPLIFMLILATATLAHSSIHKHAPSAPTSQMALRMKKRAQQMILAVLVTFVICWTPQQATLLWDVYRDPDKPKPANIADIKYTCIYLAYTNSAINPVIYIVFNDCFQYVLWKFIRCRLRRSAEVSVTPELAGEICYTFYPLITLASGVQILCSSTILTA